MTIVRELMTIAPQRCHPEDSLEKAAHLMWEHDCGCVPIVDPLDHVVGILTDRDVCMAGYTQGKPLREIAISEVCSKDVASIGPEENLERAQALMIDQQVRRLPVVDEGGRLVGILSLSDMAQHAHFVTTAQGSRASAQTLALVMEAVSRARGLRLSRDIRNSKPPPAVNNPPPAVNKVKDKRTS